MHVWKTRGMYEKAILGGGKKKMFITVKKKPPTIDTNTRNTFKNNIINGHVDMYEVV